MTGIFEHIEKLIAEHASAAVIAQELAAAKEKFVALERKVLELEVKLQHERLDRDKLQQELQKLQKDHEEESVIHSLLEFQRAKHSK